MARNTWFTDTFLQSLFEKYGVNNGVWLSQKQTAICVDNMDKHSVKRENGTHLNFTCEWQGRTVLVSYSKLNSCGCITFGMTSEESAIANEQYKQEKMESYIARFVGRPDRVEREMVFLNRKLSEAHYILESFIEDDADEETLINAKNEIDKIVSNIKMIQEIK